LLKAADIGGMNQIFIIIKVAFIFLFLGSAANTLAGSNILSCAFKSDQQYLGALPEFSYNRAPLLGYQCQHIPYYSGFLGNWFPSLPRLYLSQSSRLLASNNQSLDSTTKNDTSQAWNIALPIKRFGQGQLSVFSGQKDWHKMLQAKEDITFIPVNAQSSNDGIKITPGQQARFKRSEGVFGLSLTFPYPQDEALTELRLQRAIINQPIQANVPQFEKRSLFSSQTHIDEIMVLSESHHKGLNINWQFSLGKGEIVLKPQDTIQVDAELNKIISLRGQLEFYYQHRINRRWFSHMGWKADVYYWQQNRQDDEFQLASANTIEQQIFLGMGLSF
jgi:hypothetical protein